MVIAEKKQIFEAIEKSVNPLIIISQTGEGNAIGGSLALFLALKKIGKNPRIVCAGAVPDKFLFLSEAVAIEKKIENEKVYQLSFTAGENEIKDISYEQNDGKFNIYFNAGEGAIDRDSLKVCSKFKYDLILTVSARDLVSFSDLYSPNKELFSVIDIINIDNSAVNTRFGKINAVDSYYPTVSEVAAEIVQTILPLGYGEKIATALLAGIIFETNNFQSSVIKPETFALAGSLLASGAQRGEIIRNFYGIDFGLSAIKDKINFQTNSKIGVGGREIKKRMIDEGFKMIAAPETGSANISILPNLDFAGLIRNHFQPIVSIFQNLDVRSVFDELKAVLRRIYFWIFSGIMLATLIFGTGNQNNIFLSINNYWTRIQSSVAGVSGKIVQETSKIFLPPKKDSVPKFSNNESINSVLKSKKANIGLPVRLDIPRLGIEAEILEVGLDKSGAMEIPNSYKDVGWFKLGVRPGETGNAVITGHLDTVDTSNGIFRRLNELGAGDDVYVADTENNRLHFQVVSSKVYEAKNAPMDEIFGISKNTRLNLITCDGVWDRQAMSYDKRLVVFTELVVGI